MITGSPHLYRLHGLQLNIAAEVIENSLAAAEKVESRGLAAVLTLKHLAHSAGVSHAYLRRIVARAEDPYEDITISRRNGRKMRPISSPEPVLLQVQQWILSRILNPLPIHPSSYAYSPGRSAKICASRHLGARWLIKMDIRDFFESINEARVYRVFRGAGYESLPAFELARVCTRYAGHVARLGGKHHGDPDNYRVIRAYRRPYLGFLPQGAATSGALANQVSMQLDLKLAAMARSFDLVYTRYADDMTFSSGGDFNRPTAVKIVNIAAGVIRRNGFAPHDQKTIIAPPGARKLVLGLLVDGSEVRLSGKMRSRILNHLRAVEKFGIPQHAAHMKFSSEDGLVRHVTGLLAYAADIERPWAETLIARWGDATRRGGWGQLPSFHDR